MYAPQKWAHLHVLKELPTIVEQIMDLDGQQNSLTASFHLSKATNDLLKAIAAISALVISDDKADKREP